MELDGNLRYLRTIVDNLHDMILVLNMGDEDFYEVAYVNPAYLKSVGRTIDVIGQQVSEIFTPHNYELVKPRYETVKSTGNIVEWEDTVEVPAGKKHYAIKLVPVLNAVGDCVQIIVISRDLAV